MDSYLFDVLLNLNNRIGGKINDRDLYKEAIAQKIIIPSKRTRNLEDLFNERNIVFHKLFISGSREVESPELKKLAHEYLHVTKECFEELKKKDDELEIELKKMSERGKNLEF